MINLEWPNVSATQGNYGTLDSSGMCHLMSQLHLPQWQEEEGSLLYTVAVQVLTMMSHLMDSATELAESSATSQLNHKKCS